MFAWEGSPTLDGSVELGWRKGEGGSIAGGHFSASAAGLVFVSVRISRRGKRHLTAVSAVVAISRWRLCARQDGTVTVEVVPGPSGDLLRGRRCLAGGLFPRLCSSYVCLKMHGS